MASPSRTSVTSCACTAAPPACVMEAPEQVDATLFIAWDAPTTNIRDVPQARPEKRPSLGNRSTPPSNRLSVSLGNGSDVNQFSLTWLKFDSYGASLWRP